VGVLAAVATPTEPASRSPGERDPRERFATVLDVVEVTRTGTPKLASDEVAFPGNALNA
jgi:hypothetical protein